MMLKLRPQFLPILVLVILLMASCVESISPPQASEGTPTDAETIPDYWPTAGWRTSTPEEQGLDGLKLAEMSQVIRESVPLARAVLVIRSGYLVYEEYFKGDESYAGPVWSITKSVISAITGIAIRDGYISSPDDKLLSYFGDAIHQDMDPRFREITLRHLLTMTAGYRYKQTGEASLKDVLRDELISVPGTEASYNTRSTHLLSAVISRTTGMGTLEYADDRLFAPLGINTPRWDEDVQGLNYGGFGLYLRPREMAKIGHLYLMDGNWEERQIIPNSWVMTSTIRHAPAGVPGLPEQAGYGYLWWIQYMGDHMAYAAYGSGGQMIAVVPDLKMVMVAMTDTTKPTGIEDIVIEHVLLSVID